MVVPIDDRKGCLGLRSRFFGIVAAALVVKFCIASKALANKKDMLMSHVAHSGGFIHHIKAAASRRLAKRSGVQETA
jgi:hypothetical protein